MGLRITRRGVKHKVVVGILLFVLAFTPFFAVGQAADVFASTPVSDVSATLTKAAPTYRSGAVNGASYQNLTYSFAYNAEQLDNNDYFTYGWTVGGVDHVLGTINGNNENSHPETETDETGAVSVSLPGAALTANLTVFMTSTVNGSTGDSVLLTTIMLQGDEVAATIPVTTVAPTAVEPTCDAAGYATVHVPTGTTAYLNSKDPGNILTDGQQVEGQVWIFFEANSGYTLTNPGVVYHMDSQPKLNCATYPAVPALESPASGAAINYNDFYFEWSDADGAVSYEFQASQSPSVDGNGALNVNVWHGDNTGTEPTASQAHSTGANGTWYWQVRSVNSLGMKSAWTSPWELTIDMQTPSAFQLVGPADGVTLNAADFTKFDWTDATDNSGAIKYEVLLYKDGEWIPSSGQVTNSEWTPSAPLAEGVYGWKVWAVDAAGNVTWNEDGGRTFTISNPDTPDDGEENTPPGDGDGTVDTPDETETPIEQVDDDEPQDADTFADLAPAPSTLGVSRAITSFITGNNTDDNATTQVLGTSDEDESKTTTPLKDTANVLGSEATNSGATWWLWLIALAAVVAGWWFIATARRKKKE